MKKIVALGIVAALAAACSSAKTEETPASTPAATEPATASSTVGPEGGTVSVDGVRLEIPAGALTKEETITITRTVDPAPEGYVAYSPVYWFEPEGLTFKLPGRVIFTIPEGSASPLVTFAKKDGTMQALKTEAEGAEAAAAIKRLALGFVAKGGEDVAVLDEACTCPTHCDNPNVKGKKTCIPGDKAKDQPSKQTIGNFVISDFEYWPWKEDDPIYPDKVLWGYYAGGPEAQRCMTEARKVLVDILKNDVPPELEELRKKHGVRAFYNWNNDMTGAPKSRTLPALYEGLWLYEESLIKWMSHTERDGSCRLPNRDDLVTFAKACITNFPNCDSGK